MPQNVRVTMTRTVYGAGGSLMSSGSTYTVPESLAGELIGQRAATDTDGFFTPGNSSANFRPADGASTISVTSTSLFYQMGPADRVRFATSGLVRVRFGSYSDSASRTADMLVASGNVYDRPQSAAGFAIVTDSTEGGTVSVNVALGS